MTHTFGRSPLDEGLARRRDLFLTTTTRTTESHPNPGRDSIPQSQQASGRSPTPYNAQGLARPHTPLLLILFTTDYLQSFYHISPHFTLLTGQSVRK